MPNAWAHVSAVLFDIDGTLVDTSALDALREQRNWRGCVAAFHRTSLYAGIQELIKELETRGIPWATVTTSVSYYADNLLKHHGLHPSVRIAYHDARPKPAPDPCLLAMKHLGVQTGVVGFGDRRADFESFVSAGVSPFCAAWNRSAATELGWPSLQHPADFFAAVMKVQGV